MVRRRAHSETWIAAGVWLVVLSCAVPRGASADLRAALTRGGLLTPLGDAAAGSLARSLTVPSSSAPVVYSFDPDTGAFVRDDVVGANVQLESPEALGRRHVSVRLSYQFFDFERFGGRDLDSLRDPRPVVDGRTKFPLVAFDKVDIDLTVHQAMLAVTYGVTDRLDVDLVVPVLASRLSRADTVRDYLSGMPLSGRVTDSAVGIGDVQVRGKLQVPVDGPIDLAIGLGLRLPSGNEDDFQGTGGVDVQPSLTMASRKWSPTSGIVMRAVLNAAMVLAAERLDESEGQWAAGVDAMILEAITAEAAIAGRHAVSRLASEHAFDLERCVAGCRSGAAASRTASLPLFGFSGDRPDYYDFVVGLRWGIYSRAFVFAGGRFPLNREGLRAGPVPTCGIEATF